MAWIDTIPLSRNSAGLRDALEALLPGFPAEYQQAVQRALKDETGGIIGSHSLLPETARHTFAAFASLLSPDLTLTRRQQEMIATVVSAANQCDYCAESHAEFLRHVTQDAGLAEALKGDYRAADLPDRDRVMLDYVWQVTREPGRITSANHDRLRAAGFDDRGILQITLIAAWFNYFNRVADALGLGKENP